MNLASLLNFLWMYRNKHTGSIKNLSALQKLECSDLVCQLEALVESNQFNLRVEREPNAALTNEEEQWLIDLLRKRWDRIKGTNSCYTQHSENPANIICIEIAKELAGGPNKNWREILMPTITGVVNQIREIEYSDNDFPLEHYVTTDDNLGLIHVDTVLREFEIHGVMNKYQQGRSIELTESEKERVKNHTAKTKKQFLLLQAKIDMKNISGTLGYALEQLNISLRQSSTKGSGTEFKASSEADEAIINLLTAIESLSEADKQILFNARYIDSQHRTVTFKYIWDAMTDPRISITNAAKCTATLSDQINDILNNNPQLYAIVLNQDLIIHTAINKQKKKYLKSQDAYAQQGISKVIQSFQYEPSAEAKFIPAILSTETGLLLFCKNKNHIRFLVQLDENTKIICLRTLLSSDKGNSYVSQAIKLLKGQHLELMSKLIEQVKDESQINENELSSDDMSWVSLSDEESSSQESKEAEWIKFLPEDYELLETIQGTDEQRFERAIKLSLQTSQDIKADKQSSSVSSSNNPNKSQINREIIVLDEEPEKMKPIDNDVMDVEEKENDFDRRLPELKRPQTPLRTPSLLDDLLDTMDREHAEINSYSLKRSHEENTDLPAAKRSRVDSVIINQPQVSISSAGFFASSQETRGEVTLSSSADRLRQKRNHLNVTEYVNALTNFRVAIEQRKLVDAKNFLSQMGMFLEQNKDKLHQGWYEGKCRDLIEFKSYLTKAMEFHHEQEVNFFVENALTISKMDGFIRKNCFFEPVHYLHTLMKLISEKRFLYSDSWYRERLVKYKNRIEQCISNLLDTNIADLINKYSGSIQDILSWRRYFLDMGEFLYKEAKSENYNKAIKKIDLLLEVLQQMPVDGPKEETHKPISGPQ